MQELIQLPLNIQAILVAGYMGYALYKRDNRKNESKTDMLILMLVFGMPTAIALQLCNSVWTYLWIFSAPVMAFIWLKLGQSYWQKLLYKTDVSYHADDGNVWKTLGSSKGIFAKQIVLYTKDDKQYLCNNTEDFYNDYHAPFAPFLIDDDGIAFYVTHTIMPTDDDWVEVEDVINEQVGSTLTYFPRDNIRLLEMRMTQPNANK